MTDLIKIEQKSLSTQTKADFTGIAKNIANEINEGRMDAREALVLSKKISELGSTIEKIVRPLAEGVTIPIQKGGEVILGANVVEKNGTTKYDFTPCNDSLYTELLAKRAVFDEKIAKIEVQKEKIDAKIKERESFLKSVPKEGISTMDGEVINPPIVTYGKITLAVTIK